MGKSRARNGYHTLLWVTDRASRLVVFWKKELVDKAYARALLCSFSEFNNISSVWMWWGLHLTYLSHVMFLAEQIWLNLVLSGKLFLHFWFYLTRRFLSGVNWQILSVSGVVHVSILTSKPQWKKKAPRLTFAPLLRQLQSWWRPSI